MDDQQGPSVQHRELCLMLFDSLDGRRVWGRMDTCICISESLFCLPETITTLLINLTPIQNKNFKIIKKKVLKGKNLQPRLLYPERILFKIVGEIKTFSDKQNLREVSTTKPTLQQMLKRLI